MCDDYKLPDEQDGLVKYGTIDLRGAVFSMGRVRRERNDPAEIKRAALARENITLPKMPWDEKS
jgi:hypothetical protein